MYRQWPSVCLLWKTFIHICPFLKSDCLIFLLLSCMSSLCILDISSLSDVWFTNIFSHSVSCLFILLIVSFVMQSFLLWCSPSCLFFFCCCCFWCQIFKNHYQGLCQGAYCVSSRRFMVSGFTFKSLIHLELIFEYSKIVVQFHFFASGCCPFFPTPFIEETVLFPLYILGSFVKN